MAGITYDDALDEAGRRRPEWRPGVPIRLSNGQDWMFAPPRVRQVPLVGPRPASLMPAWDFGEGFAPEAPELRAVYPVAYQKLVDRFSAAGDDAAARLEALLELAVLCLRANYYVSDGDVEPLLGPGADPEAALSRLATLSDALILRPLNAWNRAAEAALGRPGGLRRDPERN